MRTPRLLAALALLALIAGPVLAMEPEHEPLVWTPVEVAIAPSMGSRPLRSEVPRVSDRRVGGSESGPTRPVVHIPESPVIVVQVGSEHGVGAPSGHSVAGVASWFCGHGSPCTRGYPGGLYAAAGPALRVGDWRGRLVRVEAAGVSVQVRLIDCNCGRNANLIDLYSDAFERLGPLSRGVLKVTVSW